MKYLINSVIPTTGDSITTKEYRNKLEKLGYNFYQQIGSLGGSKKAGAIDINYSVVTRK